MAATSTTTSTVDLAFAGVVRQAELIRTGEVSSRELTEIFLDRIFRLDQRLNAFRVVFGARARAGADQADARRGAGNERPLLGVPIAIKDDQDLAGEPTCLGTNAHRGPAPADAEIVRRLRDAGAVVVGKTNVPELMITPFTESPTYGATRNPWAPDRTAGGSSGGSGAAVAAGLVGAATASDGAGSIRIPAACCALVGLKPQRGRVPRHPHQGDWHELSTFGFVTRGVADTALLYDVVKASGPSFAQAAARPPGKLRIALSTAVPKPIMGKADATMRGAVETMAGRLRDLGHEVFERDPDYGDAIFGVIARYLRGIHDDAKSLPHPERLSRRTKGFVRMGSLVVPPLLERVKDREPAQCERFNAIFRDADLVLTPMFTRIPLRVGELEGYGAARTFDAEARFTPFPGIANLTGQPAISLPVSSTPEGIPLAVQFLAPTDGEPTLLSLAAQLEEAIGWPKHRPPQFA